MADVITSQPESVAVAAVPAWATEIRKYAVEAIGAFFLTFVVVVSVLSHSVFTPLAAGATLMVMIYAGGHISGGHYNPAVTMGALVRRRIGIGEAVGYWIAQVVGGIVAAVIGRAVVNPPAVSTLTLTGHTPRPPPACSPGRRSGSTWSSNSALASRRGWPSWCSTPATGCCARTPAARTRPGPPDPTRCQHRAP
jgi:glycerol uptake facilitator-like aquaporin